MPAEQQEQTSGELADIEMEMKKTSEAIPRK